MLRQAAMFEKSGTADTYSTVAKAVAKGKETWAAKLMLRTQPPAEFKWPDPESSIGRHRSSLGKLNFWDITGPATSLIPLKKEVKILFDKHVDHLKPDPKKDFSPTILFDLFMTGCSDNTACPTLVIICADKSSRGKAIKLVRDSKLLEKPEYSPVLLGQCSKNPRYLNAQLPREIATDSAPLENAVILRRPVFMNRSDLKPSHGLSIYIPTEGPQKYRKATLGGFLGLTLSNGETVVVGMTVAHAFKPSSAAEVETDSGSEDDLAEFEFDGPTPEAIPLEQLIQQDPKVDALDVSSAEGAIPIIFKEKDANFVEIGYLCASSATNVGLKSDWALVQITTQELGRLDDLVSELFNTLPPFKSPNDSDVVAFTGSKGLVHGEVCKSSTFLKIENGSSFEETRTVQLEDKLAYGDWGSWIIHKESRSFFGHLFAGDPETGLAYMSSAEHVIGDIEQQLDCKVKVGLAGTAKRTTRKMSGEGDDLPLSKSEKYSESTDREHISSTNTLTTEPLLATVNSTNAARLEMSRNNTNRTGASGNSNSPVTARGVPSSSRGRRGNSNTAAATASARINEYFIPKDGIDREVITADICRYLGNNALIRPRNYKNPETRQLAQGYFITTYRNLTTAMIADLKADSARWEAERRQTAGSGRGQPSNIQYRESATHQSRAYYGPTELTSGTGSGMGSMYTDSAAYSNAAYPSSVWATAPLYVASANMSSSLTNHLPAVPGRGASSYLTRPSSTPYSTPTDPYYGRAGQVQRSYGSSQYYTPPTSDAQYPTPTDPYYGRVDPLPEDTYITPTYSDSDPAISRSATPGPNTSSLDDSSNIGRSIQ